MKKMDLDMHGASNFLELQLKHVVLVVMARFWCDIKNDNFV